MIGSFNTSVEKTGMEYTLLPIFWGWTITKQCLANPQDCSDLELLLSEMDLEAADVVRTLCIAIQNDVQVDCCFFLFCKNTRANWKGPEMVS